MQSESNHIDNFFRRKEAASVADNTHTDSHWKLMNELMKTGVNTSVKETKLFITRRFMLYAAAVILVTVAALYLVFFEKRSGRSNEKVITKTINAQKKVSNIPATPDSLPYVDSRIKNSLTKNSQTYSVVVEKKSKQVNTKTENYITKKETTTTEIATSTATKPEEDKINNIKVFNKLFKELEKPAEEFVITASKDTTITSKEGTQLTIPANAFLNASGQLIRGTVKIYLQEFYSFSDIIGNKLTTLSNDRLLATGGMVNIIAKAEGEQVKINPQQPLKLDIPTKKFDPFMQLFTGQQQSPEIVTDTLKTEAQVDRFSGPLPNTGINWTAAGQTQYSMINTSNKEITILNLMDNPYDVFYGKKVVAKFELPYDAKLNKEEMKAELEKRYSKWYDVIKVRKEWKPWAKKNRVPSKDEWYDTHKVGDSIVVSLRTATRLRMITKEDSIAYEAEFKRQYDIAVKQEIARSEWIQAKDKYSFTITDLGWINCDRFWNYRERRLTDFVFNPGSEFSESYLYSVLIFPNINSIMPGQWINGKIVFQKIPLNEYVSIISIGVKDGKTWACIDSYIIQKEEVSRMHFEETSPEQLKRKLERFGNVSRMN